MRLDTDTVEAIRVRVAPLDTDTARQAYREGRYPRSTATVDVDKRYRWDLFSAAQAWRVLALMDDVTDAHVDTALRRIVPPLDTMTPSV